MNIARLLYFVFIEPLQLLFELVFAVANRHVSNPGFAIIILSIVVNIAVFPLYHRADEIQKSEREREQKLKPQLDFLKKHFNGDERFMVIQTFYRQNNYNPLYSLKSAIPLLLQIPFFMAAYNLLSKLSILNGVKFGLLKNLGEADKMLVLGGIAINVLPILMTLINLVSGALYTKGAPNKEKIQLLVTALVFLVLLYNSPSGLVFYWTLNNVCSLIKNVIPLVIPKSFGTSVKKLKLTKCADNKKSSTSRSCTLLFFLSAIYLTVMQGFFIPAHIVAGSPTEVLDPILRDNPVKYVGYSAAIAIGVYLFWFGVIYYMATPRLRQIMTVISGVMAVYSEFAYQRYSHFFSRISALFSYNSVTFFDISSNLILKDIGWIMLFFAGVFLIYKVKDKILTFIMAVLILSFSLLFVMDVCSINKTYSDFVQPDKIGMNINLSRDGQNVIVFMLDREPGYAFTDFIENSTELQSKLDGFTFYPNTVSYGKHTNIATPALFGGYEYTPSELNKRETETLASKHDEALSVLPILFAQNDFDVSVINPPYLGYQEISNTAILNNYEGINCYYTGESFTDEGLLKQVGSTRERNLFCFSFLFSSPLFMRDFLYNCGWYNNPDSDDYIYQAFLSANDAKGIPYMVQTHYDMLTNLDDSTNIVEGINTYNVIQNMLPHEPALYNSDTWEIESKINNADDFIVDIAGGDATRTAAYQSYFVGIRLLCDWFDYLKANDLYDNTRIIVVSDHGSDFSLEQSDSIYISQFNPLLLVKDFNSKEFTISDEFMTNADTPYLAVNGVIESPVNPFTGNVISNDMKYSEPIHVSCYSNHHIDKRATVFTDDTSGWYKVHDDMREASNWEKVDSIN